MPRHLCVLLLIGSSLVAVSAQTTPKPTFEVASIKRSIPGTTGGRVQFLPGGRFVGENVSLDFLLQQVYAIRDFQIVAAPEWRAIIADGRDSRYQFQARGDEAATPEQLREMVKALLADRFGLRLHWETRTVSLYALVPMKSGPKGARASDGRGGGVATMANGWLRGNGVTTSRLAEALSRHVDRPVIDRTNLDQVLDFDLTWTPISAVPLADTGSMCPATLLEMAQKLKWKVNASCPSIFTAVQDQLGLRLDPQSGPIDVLVIDAIHAPTED
jgi:uncharacterized protein (TIGR03435 family)